MAVGGSSKPPVSEVLNAVTYFVSEVLPSSRNERGWSLNDIKKAISWGKYCESAASAPYLHSALSSLLNSMSPDCGMTVHCLKNARFLLLKNFSLNQLLPHPISSQLADISRSELGDLEAEELEASCVVTKEIYKSTIESMKLPQNKDLATHFKLRLILEAIYTSSSTRCLGKVLCHEGSLARFLDNVDIMPAHEREKLKLCLGEWMQQGLVKGNYNYGFIHQLAALPLSRLSQLCLQFPNFQRALFNAIKDIHVNSSERQECHEIEDAALIDLGRLFMKDPVLRKETIDILKEWSLFPEWHFWSQILLENDHK